MNKNETFSFGILNLDKVSGTSFNLHSMSSTNLLKVENTKAESFNFVHLLSLFLMTYNLRTIRCMKILYIPNDCSATGDLNSISGLGWVYELWFANYIWLRNCPDVHKTFPLGHLFGFCLNSRGVKRIVRLYPNYWTRVLQAVCNEFASD